jgi:hypothetical protein
MILDWLLQEVPQDLLAKLEIYTFGNAANHFNNPHLHLLSQNAALKNPRRATLTRTKTQIEGHNPSKVEKNGNGNAEKEVAGNGHEDTTTPQGKTIHHIEHYAHTQDFVSRWGVLYFISSSSVISPTAPRFMGRVFENPALNGGHQFCLHYLDNMFPLKPCSEGIGIGESGYDGCDDSCGFMEEEVEWWGRSSSREGLESSSLSASGSFNEKEDDRGEVGIADMSPVTASSTLNVLKGSFENGRGFTGQGKKKDKYKVGELSRLWLYRNGGSPKRDAVDLSV